MTEKRDYITPAEAVPYDETGRIVGYRFQGVGFTEDEQERGIRILFGDGGWCMQTFTSRRYVDLSGAEPVIQDRPEFEGRFDRPILPAGEEATLPGVPACTITFAGPVSGTHEHEGGDLKIGFTVPGTYAILFEAFPVLPAALTLTVTD
ncbi:hypothetical protein [Methylobacterium oryzae]|uniref:hypothetical protein n=1 Tax=Methylobacterium oryzae TaxID=334852 RepID=UPI001F4487C9|nr:hypothetical protein [Methylobacterium oryzae]UIN38293.1 hypothetical protein LXM90_31150 [Methylobacterium oryzae]